MLTAFAFCLCLAVDDKDQKIADLIKALGAQKEANRIKACEDLGNIGEEAKAASRAICVAATDKSEKVRHAAMEAMEKVRPDLYKHAIVLVTVDQQNLRKTMQELKKSGEDSSDLTPILAWIIKSRMVDAGEVAETIARVGINDPDVVKLVGMALKEELRTSQESGLSALAWLAGESKRHRKQIVAQLKAFSVSMKYDDNGHKAGIANAAANCGADAKEMIPYLKKLKLDSDQDVRAAATKAVDAIEKADK